MKLIVIILLCIGVSQLSAWSISEDRVCALPWEAPVAVWDVGQNLPSFVERNRLIRALRPNETLFDPPKDFESNANFKHGEAIVGLGVKALPKAKDMFVAVLETEYRRANAHGGYDANNNTLSIGVLKKDPQNGFTLVAKSAKPLCLKPRFQFNKFDLAPRKVRGIQPSFGIETCHIETYAGPGAITDIQLVEDLFAFSNGSVQKVASITL